MSTFIEMNLAVYRTERRSKATGENPGDWVPYYVLAYGTLAETNEVLSPVCYLDDIDIYNCIIAERGGNITLSKFQRSPSKPRDCRFRITFEGGDHTFRGVLQDDKGEWEWKGIYLCNQQKTHLKSHAPQAPYSHSLFEIKKHSPSATDSSPSSQSGSVFGSVYPNRTRGSGGGSYTCSTRTSVYGVIPLIEEPDDEPPTQIITLNKYDALIKEWTSISTMTYAQAEKNGYNPLTKPSGNDLRCLSLPSPWPHNQLSISSPARSRSRMRLITTGLDDSKSVQVPRSFTPFTEASEDSFYSIDTEDIPVSSSAYTDSGATIQEAPRDQSTPCPPTPQIPEITNPTEPEDDYVVLYRAWRCEPQDDVVLWT
ncbi:unnamed protein product [Rhizoctonia solani]|uniref:Uncharacterized protein n=1 Tax=Rhizoctonia solani TaxID=456999 RepID=A0A8H3EAG1_9AGAM|nr:unnamed protein product [Rhizoctonia solani]